MRVYIVEYRRYDKSTSEWISKVSQKGPTDWPVAFLHRIEWEVKK